jgi:hypothetical protein
LDKQITSIEVPQNGRAFRKNKKPINNLIFLLDISVIGALGDSLTCSTGAMAEKIFELSMENRGLAWSIGGKLK